MTNINSPFGFRYIGDVSGGSMTDALTAALVQSTNTTAIFAGDPVCPDGSGFIIQGSAAGTTQVAGIFDQVEYLAPAVGRNIWFPSWPGSGNSGNGNALIQANPFSLFVVQAFNTAIARADIGANINFVPGTGNTTTGLSGATIDSSTITTTNTLPFRIYGLWSDYAPPGSAGTDNSNPFNWAVVVFNNTSLKQLTGIA